MRNTSLRSRKKANSKNKKNKINIPAINTAIPTNILRISNTFFSNSFILSRSSLMEYEEYLVRIMSRSAVFFAYATTLYGFPSEYHTSSIFALIILSGTTIPNPGKSSPIVTIEPVILVATCGSEGKILEAPTVIITDCPIKNDGVI